MLPIEVPSHFICEPFYSKEDRVLEVMEKMEKIILLMIFYTMYIKKRKHLGGMFKRTYGHFLKSGKLKGKNCIRFFLCEKQKKQPLV